MKTIKVRDLGRIVTGHTPPTSEAKYFGDYMPFVKPTDISVDSKYTYNPEQYYSEEAAEKYKTSMIPKGSTCVVCIGTIGEKMTMAHCDMFTNQSINTIVPSEDYDPDYVYYLLKYNLGKVKALNKGTASGREYVSKSTFLDMPIEVFEEKDSQERIGKLLSTYDDAIENNSAIIALLEEKAFRLYRQIFVNGDFKTIKDKECDTYGAFDEWGQTSVGEIALFKRGKTITKGDTKQGLIPVVAGGLEPAYYHDMYNAVGPVITVSGSGANAGFARLYHTNIWASDCSFVDSSCKHILYIYCFLKNNTSLLDSLQKGAAQPHVYAKDINSLTIKNAPENLINAFESAVSPLFEEIGNLELKSKFLTEARDQLLPRIICGDISIK